MNAKAESDPLLDAVLGEIAPSAFRAALLERTLSQARRRRRLRRFKQGCLIAVALTLPFFLWNFRSQPDRGAPSAPAFGVINSQPLPVSMLVESQPGSAPVIASAASSVRWIETDPRQHFFNEIDDQGLLALIGDRPVILIRHSAHDA